MSHKTLKSVNKLESPYQNQLLENDMSDKQSKSDDKRLNNLSRAGRPKGVPNKTTAEIKQAIGVFISHNADKLNDWIAEVEDPAKRIDLYLKAMEYAVPKLARNEHVGDEKQPIVNVYKWQDD